MNVGMAMRPRDAVVGGGALLYMALRAAVRFAAQRPDVMQLLFAALMACEARDATVSAKAPRRRAKTVPPPRSRGGLEAQASVESAGGGRSEALLAGQRFVGPGTGKRPRRI